MSTQTETLEVSPTPPKTATLKSEKEAPILLHNLSGEGHTLNDLPGPGAHNVVAIQETWRYPRINTYRLAAIFFAFINFGMGDASYGALIPFVRLCSGQHDVSRLTPSPDRARLWTHVHSCGAGLLISIRGLHPGRLSQ